MEASDELDTIDSSYSVVESLSNFLSLAPHCARPSNRPLSEEPASSSGQVTPSMAALGIVGGVAGHLQMLQNEGLVAEAGFCTAESEPSTTVLQKWLWLEIFGN